MLHARPELANMELAENDEHRPLHYAVLTRSPEMVRLLMQHGADARQGIYPHRPATTVMAIATARGYDEIVAIIEDEEGRRRGSATPAPDELAEALFDGDEAETLARMERDPALIRAVTRDGWTPLHLAAALDRGRVVEWLVTHGADPNARGPRGMTPLDAAAARASQAASQVLRQHGAGMTARAAVATRGCRLAARAARRRDPGEPAGLAHRRTPHHRGETRPRGDTQAAARFRIGSE